MLEDSLDNNSLPPRLYHNQKFRLRAPPLSKTWLSTGPFLYRSCSQPQLVWALITMCLRRWHFVAPLLIPALTLSSAPIPQCFLNFRWMSWMPCLGLITQPSLTTNTLRSYGLCIRYSPLQRGDSDEGWKWHLSGPCGLVSSLSISEVSWAWKIPRGILHGLLSDTEAFESFMLL